MYLVTAVAITAVIALAVLGSIFALRKPLKCETANVSEEPDDDTNQAESGVAQVLFLLKIS